MNITNIRIWEETRKRYGNISYVNTTYKTHNITFDDIRALQKWDTSIVFYKGDCIDIAIQKINEKAKGSQNPNRVVLHNMCDWEKPGGEVRFGLSTQEEECFRRSNYYKYLTKEFYPLNTYDVLYTENVEFYRKGRKDNSELLEHPVYINMIASPAVLFPEWYTELGQSSLSGQLVLNKFFKNESDIIVMKNKIRQLLYISAKMGNEIAVYSAWGCGAYDCPVYHVGILFGEVAREYYGILKEICFAINDDNYGPFKEGFDLGYKNIKI